MNKNITKLLRQEARILYDARHEPRITAVSYTKKHRFFNDEAQKALDALREMRTSYRASDGLGSSSS